MMKHPSIILLCCLCCALCAVISCCNDKTVAPAVEDQGDNPEDSPEDNPDNYPEDCPDDQSPEPESVLLFTHPDNLELFYPNCSPDGSLIALEIDEKLDFGRGYTAHAWVIDLTSQESRQVTGGLADSWLNDDRNLRIGADNTYTYFTRGVDTDEDGYAEHRVLGRTLVQGSEADVQILTDHSINCHGFALMPDGERILVYYTYPGYDQGNTAFYDLASGEITDIPSLWGNRYLCTAVLPDGSGFYAATGRASDTLFAYGIERHYFDGRASIPLDFQHHALLIWVLSLSPDGDSLLIHQGACTTASTYRYQLSTGAETMTVTMVPPARSSVFGPDGDIYFIYDRGLWRTQPDWVDRDKEPGQ